MGTTHHFAASQESVYNDFAEAVTERVRALRLGNGLEAGVSHGPLITQQAVEGVSRRGTAGRAQVGSVPRVRCALLCIRTSPFHC